MKISQEFEEGRVTIDDIEVNYKIAGEGQPILILHGWGSSSDSWIEIQRLLTENGYRVYVPDLPGFGKSPPPAAVWGIVEYADFVYEFGQKMQLEKFVLLGHSFGGQIAIQFAQKYPQKLEKLILVAAAGVRRKAGWRTKLLKYIAKIVSFVLYLGPFRDLRNSIRNFLYMALRRKDYMKAQGIMRDVFVKVVRQDMTPLFGQVTPPTLIIWGDKDPLTPVRDAYSMKEGIPQATLEIMQDRGHALNFEVPEQLAASIVRFVKE